MLVLVKIICGIRWKIEGTDNIPDTGCVVLSNHQSTWETFYLQTIFSPQSTVIKRELLNIPFFGWAFRFLSPIAINRNDRGAAILQLITQGTHYLNKGNFILIFPEGTRHEWPNLGKFSRGGAMLAKKSGFDLIPVVHNAGRYWPNSQWLITPGVISVKIGPAISSTDKSTTELNKLAYEWVNNNQKTLD
ncbi:MAG: 1-acyl-sn-glycerol-3-phosphate acyltransferase [Endozoicomonadaceae bacterium]|nr:1-acyl-sn-glycerol-3-phosphate acyltransferase [Endozoicomonadaceae bacterium]